MYGPALFFKRTLCVLLVVLLVLLLIVGGYVLYLVLDYSRIEDRTPLEVSGGATEAMRIGESYTALTYNVGFGAYTPDFTFFMDGGTESRAKSRDSVLSVMGGILGLSKDEDADLYLFQEVDEDADRSHHVNERALLSGGFPSFDAVFALNYHSSYLFYPLTEPHGASDAGLLTLSRYRVTSSLRRSLPISTSVSKFLDLDRCYSVSRIPVEGGRELVVYNVHTSAYGGSDEIRTAQMTMLLSDMAAEYAAGNYCIAGGDFNHDLTGDSTLLFNGEASDYGWAQPFPAELLPEGIRRAVSYTGDPVPTCRNCDVPVGEGCMTLIVDGYLVSDNVAVESVENLDIGFRYSDHNPVRLVFTLLP